MDANEKKLVAIHIGGYYVSDEPEIISTVLGSCVAVCLFDPVNLVGGMNHILLPGKASIRDMNNPARFGVNAMELLINRMMKQGASRKYLHAKVFGGARVLQILSDENHVGLKNTEFVIDYLVTENIQIKNFNIGGIDSRRIYFHTDTGEVFLKRLTSNLERSTLAREESELLRKINAIVDAPSKIIYFD